jgi:FAS-associated factor 2
MLDIRKQGKVGVVILVSGEHEDDEEFKKEVLGDHELIRLLKEKDVLVWAQDVRSRDGYQGGSKHYYTVHRMKLY